jgi:putative nucleotidyltransferase with HDIG domain
MKEEISELFPELDLFEDPGLRAQTADIWHRAAEKGGWSSEDRVQMPFTLLIEKTEINIIQHTRAVTQCAIRIADVLREQYRDRIQINRDYLLAGALLHDVGKLFEYKREDGEFKKSEAGKLLRHPVSGAAFASGFDLPAEVVHIIAAHSKEGDAVTRTTEAVIVNHADFTNFDIFK